MRDGSATVDVIRQTVVDLPTRHAGVTVAERPPSCPYRGRSTTVLPLPGQIDHRLAPTGADRPPSTEIPKAPATVYAGGAVRTTANPSHPQPNRRSSTTVMRDCRR